MSPRNSERPQPGIYDALLVIATGALLTGILFLVWHLSDYNFQVTP